LGQRTQLRLINYQVFGEASLSMRRCRCTSEVCAADREVQAAPTRSACFGGGGRRMNGYRCSFRDTTGGVRQHDAGDFVAKDEWLVDLIYAITAHASVMKIRPTNTSVDDTHGDLARAGLRYFQFVETEIGAPMRDDCSHNKPFLL